VAVADLRVDAALKAGVDRIDLRRYTHIALAVALGADHANRRLVDQILIGAKFSRNPDGLGRAAWMMVNDDDWRFCHGEFLPAGGFFDRQCVACTTDVRRRASVRAFQLDALIALQHSDRRFSLR
jgi:hypothetical protein